MNDNMNDGKDNPHKALSGESAHNPRHIRRAAAFSDEPREVEVDSSAFFSEAQDAEPDMPEAPVPEPHEEPQEAEPPQAEREAEPTRVMPEPRPARPEAPKSEPTRVVPEHRAKPAEPPRRAERAVRRPPEPADEYEPPKRGSVMLILQAVLSVAALVQLWRTQMLPTLYLVVLAVLLALLWVVVWRCQRYRTSGIVGRVFSVVLCAAMALGCVWAQQGLAALDNVTSGLLTGAEANKITKEPFIVYLSGVDNRGELTENARSDVNILAVVNPKTKRVALINTPRDYYVDLAGTSSKDKLTHAGLYGVETSMATLGQLYGVDVDHYIRINFAGFISIVDAIGGVDVYSDYAFTSVGSPGYYDPTTFVEGWNHLDGKAALAFARERHAFASGDVQRGINQMKVIDAMLNKIKSPALLMSFSKLMDAASDCFVTSLSSEQISALVRMQLSDFAEWNIESYTVTGSGGSSTKCYSAKGQKLYVMLPDDSSVNEARALIQSVTGGEAAAEGSTSTYSSGEHDAYSATGDANAAPPPSVDETPAESEIDLPASMPTDESADSPAASEEASSSPDSAVSSEPAEGEQPADSTAAGEQPDEPLISESEAEQAASSIANKLGNFFSAIVDSAGDSSSEESPAA